MFTIHKATSDVVFVVAFMQLSVYCPDPHPGIGGANAGSFTFCSCESERYPTHWGNILLRTGDDSSRLTLLKAACCAGYKWNS